MARSPKDPGSPLVPIAIVAVVVVAILVAVFAMTGEEPPAQETIIPDEINDAAPGGAGTGPAGPSTQIGQGTPDPDRSTITSPESVGAGGADGEQGAGDEGADGGADSGADGGEAASVQEEDNVDVQESTEGAANMPAGRDAQVELNPEPGQDIVRDRDDGGAAFIPTPSGPTERVDQPAPNN